MSTAICTTYDTKEVEESLLPLTGAPSIISYLAIVSVSVVVLGPRAIM